MKKLTKRNYDLISVGVKTEGTYDPKKIFYLFEESLIVGQVKEIYDFLTWVHENNKAFGSGNYEEVFSEFKKATA